MRSCVFWIILCLSLFGCGRDFTEYELDQSAFDADVLTRIETESGINLPDGAKGLMFHYIPPIDPIVFAKIGIPDDSQENVVRQMAALTFNSNSFPKDFANDSCPWWPSNPENIVASKQGFNNGYYIETFLIQEKGQLILYLKYFSI